jgi:outer membrane usher protein
VADLKYQGPYGLYEVDTRRTLAQQSTQLSMSGGIAAIGGSLFATRALQDGYALVRVPGVKGVKTYLQNQEIGTTDGNGDVLVPNLLAYVGNRIGIADLDVPLDYAIDSAELVIAPPRRGGTLVVFPVRHLQSFQGKLQVMRRGEISVPQYGEIALTVDGKSVTSPIGADGAFYFENLVPGTYPAVIASSQGEGCAMGFVVPRSEDHMVKMGVVTCTQ